MSATPLDFKDEGQGGIEGFGHKRCFPELTEDSLYPLESWRNQEDEGRFDEFALHALVEGTWEEKLLLAGPQEKPKAPKASPAEPKPPKEPHDTDLNKPVLTLVTDLPRSSPAPLSTPITEGLTTFENLFEDTPQHLLDTDAPTTPATTPGSVQPLPLSPTEGSTSATHCTDEDSNPLPTISEEEPVPNPQAQDATVRSTAQQSESGALPEAAPTRIAITEGEATPTPIDNDDVAGQLRTAPLPKDLTTSDPPSQKGDDATTQPLHISNKENFERGLKTKRTRAEDDDGDETEDMAAAMLKRARTTFPAGDVGNAGPSSFLGEMPAFPHLKALLDWAMNKHKESEHAPEMPLGTLFPGASADGTSVADFGSLHAPVPRGVDLSYGPNLLPQPALASSSSGGELATTRQPILPGCPRLCCANRPAPLPAPVAMPFPPPPAHSFNGNYNTIPATGASTSRDKGKASATAPTRARRVNTGPPATASASSSSGRGERTSGANTRAPAIIANTIQPVAASRNATRSYETEAVWNSRSSETLVFLPVATPWSRAPERKVRFKIFAPPQQSSKDGNKKFPTPP